MFHLLRLFLYKEPHDAHCAHVHSFSFMPNPFKNDLYFVVISLIRLHASLKTFHAACEVSLVHPCLCQHLLVLQMDLT